jgi:hypothetical protein
MSIAVAALLAIGTAVMTTATVAFARGGGGGHFAGRGHFAGGRFDGGFRGRFGGFYGFGAWPYYGYGYGYGGCYVRASAYYACY